jgi:predicted tellurium resistance membrane protein TerC
VGFATRAGTHAVGREFRQHDWFLPVKSTLEIHDSLEGVEHQRDASKAGATFMRIVIQIAIIDSVFSLDSVITAVGLADDVEVMIAAVVVAVLVIMFMAGPISRFVDRHPTIKMLALAFLIMIGIALIGEGFKLHILKGYIYFAMAFSIVLELLNSKARKAAAQRAEPVKLRN